VNPARIARLRGGIYRFLALGFSYPDPELVETARGAISALEPHGLFEFSFALEVAAAAEEVAGSSLEELEVAYIALFEAGVGGAACSPFESGRIGDPRRIPEIQSTLRRTYLRFGIALEVAPDMVDHVATELEVMALLCWREAQAWPTSGLPIRALAHQRELLEEHLGRWMPAFARRVAAARRHPAYGALAHALAAFIEHERQWVDRLAAAEGM